MSARAAPGQSLIGIGKTTIWWVLGVGVVAVVAWLIVFLAMRNHNGIYGGFDLGGAQHAGRNAMIVKYGKQFTSRLKYADPAAKKVHYESVMAGGTQHVWELHMVGPRGVRYCVNVWHPHIIWSIPAVKGGPRIDIGGLTVIRKGCKFS